MIKQTLLFAIFFIHSFLFSQKTNTDNKTTPIKEQIVLQTNTDFYLSGESILYKTICLNQTNKETITLSKIAYVELVNSENISILKHKQVINNGISYNDFFIPTNIETGNYKIIAYTNLTLNNSEYALKEIFIFNPYVQFPEKFKENNNNPEVVNLSTSIDGNIISSKVKSNKKEYTKREKVSINIDDNLQGNFVFNVVKIDSIPTIQEQKNTSIFSSVYNNLENQKNTASLPETRGEVFLGKITSKNDGDDLENKKIALSIPGENFDFKIASTDKNGNFKFLLDSFDGEEAYFQVFEKDKEKYKIELSENQNIKTKNIEKDIKINPNYANAFLKRSIANQIQNIYYHTKSDTVFAYKKSKPFYYGSDKEYVLKDYNVQNAIKEVFIEIIPEVYISKKDGKQTFSVYDYEVNSSDIYYNTLVLVDGFLLQDVDEILTFDPAFFTKINFVNKGYFFNKYIFNGVVNLTTKDLNYVPKLENNYIINKKLDRPQLRKTYYNIDYSKNNLEKIPDYRYQLCWKPNVTEISSQKAFEFYTSDVSGNYKITIEGITKSGESVSMENYIIVK
ncbi:hypothetical protein G6N05_06430 [Flavobacterium sp. F372]|uniref:Carboxypeptidase regulatory-like domain-containing protein n=1 Tax=Flavobacterium bernardetii TaxID=2813823 RepID=A0ABR7J0A7_9FLAO|nr:hypothetical protein [Flavobacterium bernardetii]MBC5835398.1 hypothetical protein [Flavobacterium bernardetii]NHF69741.1 hypothetical protein [Flavobacterium bernardetii]